MSTHDEKIQALQSQFNTFSFAQAPDEKQNEYYGNVAEWSEDDLIAWYQQYPDANQFVSNVIKQKSFDGEALGLCESVEDIAEELAIDKSLCIPLWNHYVNYVNNHGISHQKAPYYIMVGKTGAGKSSFCNLICGAKADKFKTATTLNSCTKTISKQREFFMNDKSKPIILIDVPGADDNKGKNVNKQNTANIIKTLSQLQGKRVLFVIVLNSQEYRIADSLQRMLQEFTDNFGHCFWINTAIVFTKWYLNDQAVDDREMNNCTEENRAEQFCNWVHQNLNVSKSIKISKKCFFLDTHVFKYSKTNPSHQQIIIERLNKFYNTIIPPFNAGNLNITEDILAESLEWIIPQYKLDSFNVRIENVVVSQHHSKTALTLGWNVKNIEKLNCKIKNIASIQSHDLYFSIYDKTRRQMIGTIKVDRKPELFVNHLGEGQTYEFELSVCFGNCQFSFIQAQTLKVTLPINCSTCGGSGKEQILQRWNDSIVCGLCSGKGGQNDTDYSSKKCTSCRNGMKTVVTYLNCTVCDGVGESLEQAYVFGSLTCILCRGRGSFRKEVKKRCGKCKGSGSITEEKSNWKQCGFCRGNKYVSQPREQWVTSDSCSGCNGKGWMQK